MRQLFTIFILTLIFNGNLFSQLEETITLTDKSTTEINLAIDSIWTQVISWDDDYSTDKKRKRDSYASKLEDLYINQELTELSRKAILYSFFIQFRNKDTTQILTRFESLNLDEKSWEQIYPIYSRNLIGRFGFAQAMVKLDSLAKSLSCTKCKIIIYTEVGQLLYKRKQQNEAKKYLEKALNLNSSNKYDHLKQTQISQSFLRSINQLGIGQQAIYFQTLDINGETIELEKGKVTLIDFWASWCGPCRVDLPMMKRIHNKFKDNDNFRMIGISLDTKMEELSAYLEKESIQWPQICDFKKRESELVRLYNGASLPTYYLIDKNGIIRYNYQSRENKVDLESLIDEIMQ